MKKSILVVDDEEQIRKAIRRLFEQTDYHIHLAESGQQALHMLQNEKVDMILSDIRMPDLDGIELLNIVKRKYPEIIRLILSGYVDEKTIFSLFNNNLAKMCIYKPWDNEELLKIINQIFELNSILTSNSMLQIIKNIDDLPTINHIYHDLCNLIDQNKNIDDIERLLIKDQAIVAAILRIVNSAFINIKTVSLKKAISYIGLAQTKNIVMVASISHKVNLSGKLTIANELFNKHSILTNQITHLIYQKFLHKEIPADSSCVGLLHEIGRIVLMNNFPGKYEKVITLMRNKENTYSQIEKENLGITHEEMSGYLLNWWGLPYSMVEAILYHHSPLEENVINKELASAIHIADFYATKLLNEPWLDYLDMKVLDYLHIPVLDLDKLLIEKIQGDVNGLST